jgi:hypothetical protein
MNNNVISCYQRSLSGSLKFVFPLFCILICYSSFAQHPVGIFDNNLDIGNPKLPGSASYDEANQLITYQEPDRTSGSTGMNFILSIKK